jgi:phosphoglycolate phosphatase
VSAPLLVLWDIDHTLIETRGVGFEIFAAAFEKVTGRPLAEMAELAGRTEPVIFRETLASYGIADSPDLFARFAREQAQGYRDRIAELRERGRALPGAADALRALSGRPGVTQSVLTGNTREAAGVKLAAFGLDACLELDAAAYGTDSDIRSDLVGVARRRAEDRAGHPFGPDTTVLIGDTPADVVAAREGRARMVAVATGSYSAENLADAGAGTVLADLADTSAFLAAFDGCGLPQ